MLLAACSGADGRSLPEIVRESVSAAPGRSSADYRPPPPEIARVLGLSVAALAVGADLDQSPPGYRVTQVRGEGEDRLVALQEIVTDGATPGHGLYVVRPEAARSLVVQIPHPVADRSTERLGVELFDRAGAGVLMVAGAHRRAGDGAGDVAHRADSAFAAVDRAIVGRGTVIVQLHGFAAAEHPRSYGDVVVSSAEVDPSPLVRELAVALDAAGFTVCVYDGSRCGRLAGTGNVQAAHARVVGAEFVHVEISDTVRGNRERVASLLAKIADVLRDRRPGGVPAG